MKPIYLLLTGLFIFNSSFASTIEASFKFSSLSVETLGHREFSDGSVEGGSIEVDFINKQITLTLLRSVVCMKNLPCQEIALPSIYKKFPLIEVNEGRCGSKFYMGFIDRVSEEDMIDLLLVVDNSNYNCTENSKRPITLVHLETYDISGSNEPFASSFTGTRLKFLNE
ncbi:MAG: hypothetical protein KDD58_11345 [Bdellovibrionales bacterium]|nr:hypothetical protein [Bdellovibrionales bacterium]